ncbi:hypothetical protein MK489_22430 [Myxococcota bacterium]|nr:hypothetical protein [Myxococcota bacterium]
MNNSKRSVWILYIGCVLAMVFFSGGLATAARWALGLVLAAHFVEFIVKREVMSKAGGSMAHHFVQTMIYGLFHWKPLEEEQNAEG